MKMRRTPLTSALCKTILLLTAATTSSDANGQQKLSDVVVRGASRGPVPAHPAVESWAVTVGGEPGNAEYLARKHGLTNRGQIGNLKGVYLLTAPSTKETTVPISDISDAKTAALREDQMVVLVERQRSQVREKRSYARPHDPGWQKQWYLANSVGSPRRDLNVEPVWMQGLNGSSVVVGIVDDGLDWTHTDLLDNYDSGASYDFVWGDKDPTPDENSQESNSHGTSCAGEIAMSRDCSCGVGVAYGCSIGGLKMDFDIITDAMEANALGYENSYIDIYSSSWGPSDYGFSVERPGTLVQQIFATGVREGRSGKGSIYVWAAGNGGKYFDSCAADGYVNSIYTIAVGSADQDGRPADYDEACSAKMAVTFSYNSATFPPSGESWKAYDQVYTTTLGGKCTESFTGTSASAPLTSGVIALALQANSDLTWRDVQYLIVYTSNSEILTVDDLATNGAGLQFSHHFGFGAIDAEAMVTRARHWINVPEQQTIQKHIITKTKTVYTIDEVSFTVRKDDIKYLEHVVVAITLEIHGYGAPYDYEDFYNELYGDEDIYDWLGTPHPRRGDVKIELTSPAGTRSTLLPHRDYDFINTEGYTNWPFMSLHFWGENPAGTWTLQTSFRASSGHIALKDASITLHGVADIPLSVASIPSSCHPSCVRGCHAEGPQNCDSCRNFRLASTLECVDKCPNGAVPYKKYCVIGSSDDGTQCPMSEEGRSIDAKTVGLGVVAVALLVVLIVAVGLVLNRRRKNQTKFKRLFNDTTAVSS